MAEAEYKDFKDALLCWTNHPPPRKADPPGPPTPVVPHHIYQPRPQERVVNGDILRTPVDRVAARVVAKAPWWAKPPDISPSQSLPPLQEAASKPTKRKRGKTKSMSTHSVRETTITVQEPGIPGQDNGGFIKMVGGKEYIDQHRLALRIIEEINKMPQQLTPLARAALDAKGVLNENLLGIGGMMEDFHAKLKMWLDDIRVSRMNFVSETNQILTPLKDVRQFFLGYNYAEEIARLKEFVELCERLQKLKESGFLDTVADTMIRLHQ